MQYVKDDMDDLFRKAAENYIPDAGKSKWDIIQPRLSATIDSIAAPALKKKTKKNALWLLMMVMLLTGMLSLVYYNTHSNNILFAGTRKIINLNDSNMRSSYTNSAKTKSVVKSAVKEITGSTNTDDENLVQADVTSLKNKAFVDKDILTIETSKVPVQTTVNIFPSPSFVTHLAIPLNTPVTNTDITSALKNTSSSLKKIILSKQKNFYAGIIAGPELSQVKSQGFTKTGFHAGLLAGYKLHNRFAFETGLQYRKKYYYSTGQYFKMKAMAPSMVVLSLNGCSNVLEIPVRLKYQLAQTKNASVFGVAGISSEILLKENNDYRLSVNGVAQNMKSQYTKISTGFISSVDVGIGYEHNVGKTSKIRIQPYAQIPLKGMGVGHMQVMSTGINMAITHPF